MFEHVEQLVVDGSYPQLDALIDELGMDGLRHVLEAQLTDPTVSCAT